MSGERTGFERMAYMPVYIFKASIGLGRDAISQSVSVFFPQYNGAQLAEHIREEMPLHEAEVAMAAIKRGQKNNDPELEYTGEAMLANSMLKAAKDPVVPDTVTQEVAGLVDENVEDIELSPLLPDEKIDRVKRLAAVFRSVRPMFPNEK